MIRIPGLDLNLGTIFCIGRNYVEHAKELGNSVPSEPLVFLKPQSALALSGERVVLPKASARVDHECEVVLAVGKKAVNLDESQAMAVIAGYAVGLDLTARDLQDEAKKKGHPWTRSKGFPGAACVGPFVKAELPLSFSLTVNGETRQSGKTSDMLFPIPKLIQYLSREFHLNPGDLIFTGTPAGVGPLKAGDQAVAQLDRASSRLEISFA